MPETKSKGKGGKGLKKKLGPFPTYVWIVLGGVVIVGYIYYRKRQSQTNSIAGSLNQQTIPSGVIVPPSQSVGGGSDNSGGVSSAPVNFPTDYVTQTDLQNGLDNLNNEVGAQVAGITFPQPSVNISVPP